MMKPTFSLGEENKVIDNFAGFVLKDIIRAMSFALENIVNKARNTQTYGDITGNLRSSIGWAIFKGGNNQKQNFGDARRTKTEKTGKYDGINAISEVKKSTNKDAIEGIVTAGMAYSAAVEAKGYDVITGSVPTDEEFTKELKDLLS